MQHDEEIPGAMGTIMPAIALTALVIIGVYYSLNPPAEAPASVTSEAPSAAPQPSTNPYRNGNRAIVPGVTHQHGVVERHSSNGKP